MNYKDYYQILGVSRTASSQEIKKAYHMLARQYHPDINPGSKTAEQKFKEINEAHEVLSSVEKRTQYDHSSSQWQKYQSAGDKTHDLKKIITHIPAGIVIMGYVRDKIAPLVNIEFLLFHNETSAILTAEQISPLIKCDNYSRVVDNLNSFIARGMERLKQMESRVKNAESEYESLTNQVRWNDPGNPPSTLFVNFSDPDAVNSYNRKVTNYNDKVHKYHRLQDQRERAVNRYQDLVSDFNSQVRELDREIEMRKRDLTPAMDTDIVELLNQLKQIVTDNIYNHSNAFVGFIMIYLWQRAYHLLVNSIDNTNYRGSVIEISKRVNHELDEFVKRKDEAVKHHAFDALTYFYACAWNNQNILQNIHQQLASLPDSSCRHYVQVFNNTLSQQVQTDFEYKNIIEPEKLLQVMSSVTKRAKLFQQEIDGIDKILKETSVLHNQIDLVKRSIDKEAQGLVHPLTVKDATYLNTLFIVSMFSLDNAKKYMPNRSDWVISVINDLDTIYQHDLIRLINVAMQTSLFTDPIQQAINANPGLEILALTPQIKSKRQVYKSAIGQLKLIYTDMQAQPKRQIKTRDEELKNLLIFAWIPVINIFLVPVVWRKVINFLPALTSPIAMYTHFKVRLKTRIGFGFLFQIVFFIGFLFAILFTQLIPIYNQAGIDHVLNLFLQGSIIPVFMHPNEDYVWVLYGVTAAHLLSALLLIWVYIRLACIKTKKYGK